MIFSFFRCSEMRFWYLTTYIKKKTKNGRHRKVKAIILLDKSNLANSRILELNDSKLKEID
jgi:hypothetical protein